MQKHVISLLVENHAGVLSRVAGLFSRRGYNIDSLSVGETENERVSRMTIVASGDERTLEQIKKQLNKLIETIKIIELKPENAVLRELVLVKLKADEAARSSMIDIANIFRAKIIEVTPKTMTVELTGDPNKVQGFMELLKPFEIVEFIRSGATGIERGM